MIRVIKNKSGEGYASTAIKIIIAVVIGTLILGGLYMLFMSEGEITGRLHTEVGGMLEYTRALRVEPAFNEATGKYYLRYSYDGRHWTKSNTPDYGVNSTVYSVVSNNSEADPIHAALVFEGNTYHVLTSADGGINWTEKISFTASSISFFYYGTSARLPYTSGSFSGEKFVVRFKNGNNFTMISDGVTWTLPTWSDLNRI